LPATRGIWVETSKFDKLPKNAIIKGDAVLTRPRKINQDGTVDIGIMAGKWVPVADQENARELMEAGEGDEEWKEEKGIIYEPSKAAGFSQTAVSTFDKMSDVLSLRKS
jgi:hypothetical protein